LFRTGLLLFLQKNIWSYKSFILWSKAFRCGSKPICFI
jgi:hypothetical protein